MGKPTVSMECTGLVSGVVKYELGDVLLQWSVSLTTVQPHQGLRTAASMKRCQVGLMSGNGCFRLPQRSGYSGWWFRLLQVESDPGLPGNGATAEDSRSFSGKLTIKWQKIA